VGERVAFFLRGVEAEGDNDLGGFRGDLGYDGKLGGGKAVEAVDVDAFGGEKV
jgi:hypothetical protein